MSSAYYENQLRLYWSECKRPAIYESIVFHGLNCSCCSKAKASVTDDSKEKRKGPKK